jgi:hypothetical protein
MAGLLLMRRGSPLETTKSELRAIETGEKIRQIEIKRGRDAANAAADLEYKEKLDALDDKYKRNAEALRADPAARARYLARVTSRRPGDTI